MINIQALLADEFNLTNNQVSTTIKLIENGDTIPFIARYRKEATGGISDVTLRDFNERLSYLNNLELRKKEVLAAIEEQGKLTPELHAEIDGANILQRVEDLYKPYKKKRATRASKARDAGLEPLAMIILTQEQQNVSPFVLANSYISDDDNFNTNERVIQGALDIIAETVSDNAEFIAILRDYTHKHGVIVSEATNKDESTVYKMYYEFSEPIKKIANHRILAINRGEKEGKLKVKVAVDTEFAVKLLEKRVINRPGAFTDLLKTTVADSYKRLIAPTLEREMRTELTNRAETDAIKVFAKNTESLLQQRPVHNARIIAIDPGFRTGCKVAVLDEYGKLLDYATVYPTPPRSDIAGTQRMLEQYVKQYNINVIVIGNGTASRETEEVVSDFISKTHTPLRYTIVNEAGASVYSASKLASEEYPDLDVTTRGAMSLGRRLQDPLAELVKIPPQSIGVGQYQHDLNQGALSHALGDVVENVVNRVGVDLNTASASLLGYVAGISSAIAKNIVAYREKHGRINERAELKKISKLGPKAFENCVGFLRIFDGKNPLDATGVHPESYPLANELLKRAQIKAEDLVHGGSFDIKSHAGNLVELAAQFNTGLPTIRDIVVELEKPGRDIREEAPEVIFSSSIRSFDDLAIGMELVGTIRNVVDFGAFVDIGVKQDGLVHISKMADRFIKHPSEVVAVGDTVTVWITSIDKEQGKIALSMLKGK